MRQQWQVVWTIAGSNSDLPFDSELELIYDKAAELAKKLREGGSDGSVVCGTTGESSILTTEEKLNLIQVVVDLVWR